jgi:MFS family permease
LAAFWVSYELRIKDPLIDVRQVRNRSVLTADISGFLLAAAMYLFLPIIVEFVQIPVASGYGFGSSILVSGLVLVPLSLTSFLASRTLISYDRRFGTRTMIPFGAIVFAGGALFFALLHQVLWEAFVASGITGVGIGFTFAAMPGFIVRAVPPGETGSAMGFYQVLRSIGLSLGSALSAAVLNAFTHAGSTFPTFSGFRVTLIVATALCAMTALLSYLLPGRAAQRQPPPTEEVERMMEDEAEIESASLMLAGETLGIEHDASGA